MNYSVFRKLLFYAKLDVYRLLAVLNDTMLLNSVLLDAGIKSPGDRIEIIMILKDIEKNSRAKRIASPLPLGTQLQGVLGYRAFSVGSPGVPVHTPPQMSQLTTEVLQYPQRF